jgi:glycoprotein-N-acetylgalactosamine 3-beta-galactosyltransferase
MIFTTPGNWKTKGRAVRNTWAKRCHIPVFFYSRSAAGTTKTHGSINSENDTVALDVPEGRGHLTGKTMAALHYSLRTFGNVAEWFLKADDDTYVIWENLEEFLASKDARVPCYFGSLLTTHMTHGYNSGGAGYIISKSAVKKMLNASCPQDGAIEDVDVGRCLEKIGVFPGETRDTDGRLRFHWENPVSFLDGSPALLPYFYYVAADGTAFGNSKATALGRILSREAVTFHYVSPGTMYVFDFLLYKLRLPHRPYTVTHRVTALSTATP